MLGQAKALSAQARLADMNPETESVVIEQRLDADNAGELVRDWDIVVDGTDNFMARYALNDACIRHDKPLVYGAVMRFQGQVSVFQPSVADESGEASACFRCLMPEQPSAGEAPACAEAGVLGVMPGIVGILQASEALKLAPGLGHTLIGSLLMIDLMNMDFRRARIRRNPSCRSC